jgi:hypothetical protein
LEGPYRFLSISQLARNVCEQKNLQIQRKNWVNVLKIIPGHQILKTVMLLVTGDPTRIFSREACRCCSRKYQEANQGPNQYETDTL